MLRLFVALQLPQEVRARLTGLMGGVPGARWQTDDQLHLTLRFIGEVHEDQAEDIDSALQQVRLAPFDVAVQGVGLFGTLKKPRILWAGLSPADPLVQLNQKIEGALGRAGVPPAERKYMPHITLARFKGPVHRLDRFLSDYGDLFIPPWRVDHMTLFESHLAHTGAIYHPLAHYPEQDDG